MLAFLKKQALVTANGVRQYPGPLLFLLLFAAWFIVWLLPVPFDANLVSPKRTKG